jgi:hypothetical protein
VNPPLQPQIHRCLDHTSMRLRRSETPFLPFLTFPSQFLRENRLLSPLPFPLVLPSLLARPSRVLRLLHSPEPQAFGRKPVNPPPQPQIHRGLDLRRMESLLLAIRTYA